MDVQAGLFLELEEKEHNINKALGIQCRVLNDRMSLVLLKMNLGFQCSRNATGLRYVGEEGRGKVDPLVPLLWCEDSHRA